MLTNTTSIYTYENMEVEYEKIDIESVVKSFRHDTNMLVMSYDGNNITRNEVASTRSSDSKDFICIQYGDNNSIVLTPTQRLYEPRLKKYIKASDINASNTILTSQLDLMPVTHKHNIKNTQTASVYTISVSNDQCFFANDVLVHNGE
jgi:hypothetical protein